MFRESSIVTWNKTKVLDIQAGTPNKVEFNFRKLWGSAVTNNLNMESLAFFHVHPRGFLRMSALDINCITGLALGLGVNIHTFGIISFKDDELESINFDIQVYAFDKRTQSVCASYYLKRDPDKNIGFGYDANKDLISEEHLHLLKKMSYSDFNMEETI